MRETTNEIFFNKEKATRCLSKLKDYFKEIKTVASIEYPNTIVYGSNEWLIYMFYSCLLDYGMKSKLYHSRLVQTYYQHKDIFNPKMVIQYREDELLYIIKENIHPRYPNIALKKWLLLSNELNKYDNLLETVQSFSNFNTLTLFIQEMHGYGQKTGGLLLRLIAEANICCFDETIPFIPLDRHDMEISYLNGIIPVKKLNDRQIRKLSDLLIYIGMQLKISPCDLDKYLWEIGNHFCNKKDCIHCPLQDNCQTKL